MNITLSGAFTIKFFSRKLYVIHKQKLDKWKTYLEDKIIKCFLSIVIDGVKRHGFQLEPANRISLSCSSMDHTPDVFFNQISYSSLDNEKSIHNGYQLLRR